MNTDHHFEYLLMQGSPEELGSFMPSLNGVVRGYLLARLFEFDLQQPEYPLEYCIRKLHVGKVKLLLEHGASVTVYSAEEPIANRTPLATAVFIAAEYQYPSVVDVILTEARLRGCLDTTISSTFRRCAEAPLLNVSVLRVIEEDAAETIELLLDAGFESERGDKDNNDDDDDGDNDYHATDDSAHEAVDTRPRPTDPTPADNEWDPYSLSDQVYEHLERRLAGPCLSLPAAFLHPIVVARLAQVGAVKSLRALHARCAPARWTQLLAPGPTWEQFCVSPLALAFDHSHDYDISTGNAAADFIASFHRPGGPGGGGDGGGEGPDLLPAEFETRVFQRHATALDADALLAAARAEWDTCTRLGAACVLAQSPNSVAAALRCGLHRALPALVHHSRDPAAAARLLRDRLWSAPSAAAAEAALAVLVADLRARERVPAIDDDDAKLRRRIVTETYATAARGNRGWKAPAVPALLAHKPYIDDPAAVFLRGSGEQLFDASGPPLVSTARAQLGLDGSGIGLPFGKMEEFRARSGPLLSRALGVCHLGYVQLFIECGASLLQTVQCGNLLNAAFEGVPHRARRAPAQYVLPYAPTDGLDPAVVTDGLFASATAARAHAAAADAEEERYLAAALADPDFEWGARGHLWYAGNRRELEATVCARWVWREMRARDACAARGSLFRARLGQPPIACAAAHGNARAVRFFASLGARFDESAGEVLARACRDGKYELAWALLGALPGDAAMRARALKLRNGEAALDAVVLAAQVGHRFAEPLADEIVRAGGGAATQALVRTLCGPSKGRALCGEVGRALRWVLQNITDSLSTRKSMCHIQ